MQPASPPEYIFVYGTLRPGLAPPVIADVVDALRIVGPASVPGRLYDLGPYPGCVLVDGEETLVHGVLLELPNKSLLAQLDDYECYAAHDAAGSLFLRTTCQATMADGQCVDAWIYVYNRRLGGARLITSGRYDRPPT
jgi:gamma-glutamylcyclotransferase (GGCT)/AIG2-like uncharacterized protein YtfP